MRQEQTSIYLCFLLTEITVSDYVSEVPPTTKKPTDRGRGQQGIAGQRPIDMSQCLPKAVAADLCMLMDDRQTLAIANCVATLPKQYTPVSLHQSESNMCVSHKLHNCHEFVGTRHEMMFAGSTRLRSGSKRPPTHESDPTVSPTTGRGRGLA